MCLQNSRLLLEQKGLKFETVNLNPKNNRNFHLNYKFKCMQVWGNLVPNISRKQPFPEMGIPVCVIHGIENGACIFQCDLS